MSVANFIPQVWVAALVSALRKNLVYAGPDIVNRDYEGQIRDKGDTVKVSSVGRPTIKDYVPNVTTIIPEKLNTASRSLVIDQAKHFAFEVDDVDARQVAGDLITEAMSESAYGLADTVDQYIANMYTSIPASNLLPDITDWSGFTTDEALGRKAYRILVDLKTIMGERNIPKQGRYVVVPEWFHSLILLNPNFIEVSKYGSTEGLLNGEVGKAATFKILVSNNNPEPVPGTTNFLQAGIAKAISFAEQINKTKAYEPESSFSDAVKGLALYGGKVMRPDLLAGVEVTRPA